MTFVKTFCYQISICKRKYVLGAAKVSVPPQAVDRTY